MGAEYKYLLEFNAAELVKILCATSSIKIIQQNSLACLCRMLHSKDNLLLGFLGVLIYNLLGTTNNSMIAKAY
jgi:hypothetical protein